MNELESIIYVRILQKSMFTLIVLVLFGANKMMLNLIRLIMIWMLLMCRWVAH